MRVLMILPHPIEGPSSRFRAYQFIPFLEANGMDVTVRPFLSSQLMPQLYTGATLAKKLTFTAYGAMQRAFDVLRASRHDVVYVLREAFPFGPPAIENLLQLSAGRLVFDFDDAIYTRSLAYDNPLDRLRDWNKTGKIIKNANRVIAGSHYLAAYARQFNASESIRVIPTVVDPQQYLPDPNRDLRKDITVGWIGTPRGSGYLKDLMPAFRTVLKNCPNVKFVFVGAKGFDDEGLPIEFRSWSLEREPADVASFDIGIMPLTDDEETRGKCGFKLIQYMSASVVPVCSPIGANIDIVKNGLNGLYATSIDEWASGLVTLAQNAERRSQMGALGRQIVIDRFSTAYAAPLLRDVLLEAGSRR